MTTLLRKGLRWLQHSVNSWGVSPGAAWALVTAVIILLGALVEHCDGPDRRPYRQPRRPLTLEEYFAPDGPATQAERDQLMRDLLREKWQSGKLTPEERDALQDAIHPPNPPPLIPRPTPKPSSEPSPLPTPKPRPVISWIWPARGPITSYFGPGHPLGIDIAIVTGTPILAAAAGRVELVGGNPCCSYGYQVVVRHPNGWASRYAHFLDFAVVPGQWVEQGQILGRSDNTGFSTGPHLHFEIINQWGQVVNPLTYLPAATMPAEDDQDPYLLLGLLGIMVVIYFWLTIRRITR